MSGAASWTLITSAKSTLLTRRRPPPGVSTAVHDRWSHMKIISSTLMVGLYGSLTPNPWTRPGGEPDAYSLFVSRARAAGWSAAGAGGLALDIWGMNEAEVFADAPPGGLVATFQVGLADESGSRPLPVVPLVDCAVAAASRLGSLRLTGLQMLLPVQLCGSATPQLGAAEIWYADRPTSERRRWRCVLDTGEDPVLIDVRDRLAEGLLEGPASRIFTVTMPMLVGEPDAASHMVALANEQWMGSDHNAVVFDVSTPDDDPDTLALFLLAAADAARRSGIRTTMLAGLDSPQAVG